MRVKALSNPISVQRNCKLLFEGCNNIRENQEKMSSISLKISGKIREFFPQIVVPTLCVFSCPNLYSPVLCLCSPCLVCLTLLLTDLNRRNFSTEVIKKPRTLHCWAKSFQMRKCVNLLCIGKFDLICKSFIQLIVGRHSQLSLVILQMS